MNRRWFLGGGALIALAGCQFFGQNSPSKITQTSRRSLLSQLKPGKDFVQLDVLIVDRRADDPLIGPILWQEVDQVSALPAATRELMQQNGCVVGHAAAKPPMPLLQLLGLVPEIDGLSADAGALPKQKVAGRMYSVRSGTETEVQISDLVPELDVAIVDPGQTREVHFERCRFVFRVKPIRLQDGWVRVEFVPEIHHGDLQLRPTPTDDVGWAYKSTQNIEQCYPQKFSITLNVGEAAVITAAPDGVETLGGKIFRREQNGEQRQRLLVVRLADMGRTVKPVD